MQTILTLEKAIRENYLPVWQNQIGIESTPFLDRVKKVPLAGQKIVAAAPIGMSGNFGFGDEGKATPTSGGMQFEKFVANPKDLYSNICISVKAVRLGKTPSAMIDALDTEIRASYEEAKFHQGRALFGNGTGILTTCSAVTPAGTTITVDSVKNLREGMTIDIYATSASTPQANGAGRRIKTIDRANKTITLYGADSTFSAGFITVQNSYNREYTGLGAIFDDNITSLYGVSKTTNLYLKPVVVNANSDINDTLITKALRQAQRDKGSNVDMLLCGDTAFDAYSEYLRTNNYRVEEHYLKGGFKAIKFLFGNREVDVVNESFVTDNEIWGVDSSAFELHQDSWDFCDLRGGGAFNLMEGSSVYRGLLANYGELICKNPGGCVRIYGVA